jgi:hypothetical protein
VLEPELEPVTAGGCSVGCALALASFLTLILATYGAWSLLVDLWP